MKNNIDIETERKAFVANYCKKYPTLDRGHFMRNGDGCFAAYRLEEKFEGWLIARAALVPPSPADPTIKDFLTVGKDSEAFEKWAMKEGYIGTEANGEYRVVAADCWKAWQAALASNVQPIVPNEPFAHFQWNSRWKSWEQVVDSAAGQPHVVAAYRQARTEVPEGWRFVPMNPTPEMIQAAWDKANELHGTPDGDDPLPRFQYIAMLAAAPTPAEVQQ